MLQQACSELIVFFFCPCIDFYTFFFVPAASSFYFQRSENALCNKAVLSPPWTSRSEVSCIAECKSRFGDSCRNVVFNTHTMACTPVYPLSRDDPSLPSQPGDVFYTETVAPTLACDTAAGFQLREACGTGACLLHRSKTTYYQAVSDCSNKAAILFQPDTHERFALLEQIFSGQAWAGLHKVSGSWVWQSGHSVDFEFYNFMWSPGQPDTSNNELCVSYAYWDPFDKFHDYACGHSFEYFLSRTIE